MANAKGLTWEDLANEYDAGHGGGQQARTLPMEKVFDWAALQTDKFRVLADGTIHRVEER